MVQSLLIGRKSKCIINGIHSNIIRTISGPYQGSPPAARIWCVYFNPLLRYIENKCILRDTQSNIIANIRSFGYMDDLTIITNIIKQYPINVIQGKSIKQLPKHNQQQLITLFQNAVDAVTYYFSINNHQGRKQNSFMTINEYGYKPHMGHQHII